jgi:hypothetical protein
MQQVDQSDSSVLQWGTCSACEDDLLDGGVSALESHSALDTLLDEVYLIVVEHLSHHVPCQLDFI